MDVFHESNIHQIGALGGFGGQLVNRPLPLDLTPDL
jgi:hypothetical protein